MHSQIISIPSFNDINLNEFFVCLLRLILNICFCFEWNTILSFNVLFRHVFIFMLIVIKYVSDNEICLLFLSVSESVCWNANGKWNWMISNTWNQLWFLKIIEMLFDWMRKEKNWTAQQIQFEISCRTWNLYYFVFSNRNTTANFSEFREMKL